MFRSGTITITPEWAKNFGIKFKNTASGQDSIEIKPELVKEDKEKILIKFSFVNGENKKSQTQEIKYIKKELSPPQATFAGWAFLVISDNWENTNREQDKKRAKELLEGAIKQKINSCLPRYLLADANLMDYDIFETRDLYEGLEKDDVFPDYYLLLWRKEKNRFKANSVIEKGWHKFAKNAALASRYADIRLEENKPKECLDIIKSSQPFQGDISRMDYERLVNISYEANVRLKQYEKAEKLINNSSLGDEDKNLFLASLLYRQKKYAKAKNAFIKALETARPESNVIPASLYYLLSIYQKNHNTQKIKEGIELLPEKSDEFAVFPFDFFYDDFAEKTLRSLLKERLDELTKARVKGFLSYIIWHIHLSRITSNRELTKKEKALTKEGFQLIKDALRFHPDNSFFNVIASNYFSFKKDYDNSVACAFRSLLNKKEDSTLDDGHSKFDKCSGDFLNEYAERLKSIADEMPIPVEKYIDEWFPYDIETLFKKKLYHPIANLFLWVKEHRSWQDIAKKFQETENELGEYAGGGLFEIAYSLNEIGNSKEAKNLYEYLINTKGKTSAVLNNLAMINEKSGNLIKAKELIKEAKKVLGNQKDEIIDRNFARLIKHSRKSHSSTRTSKQEKETKGKKTAPTFDVGAGEIIFGEKKCSIPLGSNQYQLCKAIFEKPLGEWIKETDVLSNFFRDSDSQRSFYDAVRLVNQKIESDIGIKKMLEFKAASARIRKEIFE